MPDATSEDRRLLAWVVLAKRPETRAKRIAEIADKAVRNERANEPLSRERRATESG